MPRYKLKPGMTIGALAAESDKQFLDEAFVDNGNLAQLLDSADPHFLILGRAGAGKTALIERLRLQEHASVLDPDELSMQYLHNSTALQTLKTWGVNLDIFYKYLWRHVCILELIRLRYGGEGDVPAAVHSIFDITRLFGRGEPKDSRETREASQKYLRDYGKEYWIKADTRIKQITSEMEARLKSDNEIAANLNFGSGEAKAKLGSQTDARAAERIEAEIVARAQSIVSDFLISDLHKVVDLLGKHGFEDDQPGYFLAVDDLDKNWMPDDALYLDLLKSLLYTVQDLNRRLRAVKIVVALREDIFQRVFRKASPHEPQREKWSDYQVRVRWTDYQLAELVNRRLAIVFRGQYTAAAPTLDQVLPPPKKNRKKPFEYILGRTLMRPRDVIDFVNTIFRCADSPSQLVWRDIFRAEGEYSKRRLNSVLDEWRNCYSSLPATFSFLQRRRGAFPFNDVTEEELEAVLMHDTAESCTWLQGLRARYMDGALSVEDLRCEIASVLFQVGLLGVRLPSTGRFEYAFDELLSFTSDLLTQARFCVHPMFHRALGIVDGTGDEAQVNV